MDEIDNLYSFEGPSDMSSAEEQIQALRSENESLTAAAEVVAAVTEEYAADASRWRKTVQMLNGVTDIEGTITELADASRRKDNRIERMTAEASELRHQLAEKAKRIETLEALYSVSEQIKRTLLDQLDVLSNTSHFALASASPSGSRSNACNRCRILLECIDAMLRPIAKSDVAYLRLRSVARILFYAQMSVNECGIGTGLISRFTAREKQPVLEAMEHAKVKVEHVRAWVSTLPENAKTKWEKVLDAVIRIEERVRLLNRAIRDASFSGASLESLTKMHCALVHKAVNSLMHTLPQAYRTGDFPTKPVDLTNTISELISQQLAGLATEVLRQVPDKVTENAVSQAEIWKARLERKEEELDDARVRVKVFEERLAINLHAKEDADNLRIKLEHKEREVKALRDDLSETSTKLAAMSTSADNAQQMKSSPKHTAPNGNHKVTKESLSDALVLEHVMDEQKRRIRRSQVEVVTHFLADLRTLSDARRQKDIQRLTEMKLGILSASLLCKRSAAASQVVRLDPKTLRPLVEGVSLSRGSMISSAALAQRELERLNAMRIPQPPRQSFRLQTSSPQESMISFSSVSRALNIIS